MTHYIIEQAAIQIGEPGPVNESVSAFVQIVLDVAGQLSEAARAPMIKRVSDLIKSGEPDFVERVLDALFGPVEGSV